MGTYGPWSGKVKNGYVYGRGAADMKGGLCASIMAVKLLKEIGFDPKGSVLISAVSDEEKGGIYGTRHLLEKGLLNGDFGICGEPSDGRVQVGGGGSIGAFITYTSETGHCFKPHPSIDALKKSITAINELYKLDQRLREHYFPLYDATTCLSVSSLHSGDATNTHPAMSRFSVDLRIFPGQSVEWAHKQIRDVLDDLKNKNPEFEYTYEIEREFPNFELDQDDENVNKIVSAARSVYGQVTGTPAEIYRTTGSADANTIVDDTGMAMICIGPGEHKEMKQPDEKISIEKYLNIVETYMGIIVRLLS